MKLDTHDRIKLVFFTSDMSTLTLLEAMCVGLNSDKEETEIWALNNLRKWGALKKKQIEEGRDPTRYRQEYIDLISKLVDEASNRP